MSQNPTLNNTQRSRVDLNSLPQVNQDLPEDLVSLTTMLDRALNPRPSMKVKIQPVGIYGLPEDLLKSTEANPAYQWKVHLWGTTTEGGKLAPRELTEEEIEAQKNKGKPKPKEAPGKAGDKGESAPPPPQLTPEEEEKKRIKDLEDKYKNPHVKFTIEDARPKEHVEGSVLAAAPGVSQPGKSGAPAQAATSQPPAAQPQVSQPVPTNAENSVTERSQHQENPFIHKLEGAGLQEMEMSLQEGYATVRIERIPVLSEDELGKLRKKLKGAQLKDLRPMVCEAKVPVKELQKPGSQHILIRGVLKQVGDFTSDEECNEFKINGMYVKIEVTAEDNEYFTPPINNLFPKTIDLGEAAHHNYKISSRSTAETNFDTTLQKSLVTISADYKANVKKDPLEAENQERMPPHKRNQLNQKKLQRKTEYVKKFMSGPKYNYLKLELAPLIMRIVHDKMEKEMVGDSKANFDADRLISELNIFFQRKLENSINTVVSLSEEFAPHEDLIESYYEERRAKTSFYEEIGMETSHGRLLRLAKEYYCLNLKVIAEKRYVDAALQTKGASQRVLQEFMMYDLQQGNFIRAEETLWKILNNNKDPKDEMVLVEACFYIRRGKVDHALHLIEGLLAKNKFTPLHNTFMAFLYQFYYDRPKLAKKYFAVSQRMKQRELNLIPPAKAKPDKNPEKIPELSEKENDELWSELAEFFNRYCFVDLIAKAIEMISNKGSYKALSFMQSLEFLRNNLDKADEYLDKMIEVGGPSKKSEVYVYKATNAFIREYYYEAEELIYSALRQSPDTADATMGLRLGYIYLWRKSYDDAQVIFDKVCNANPLSAMSWLGLGISSFRLSEQLYDAMSQGTEMERAEKDRLDRPRAEEEYHKAESAFRMANIFDPTNPDVWGYTVLLSLKDTRKVEQAITLLNYLLTLQPESIDVVYEIGCVFSLLGLYEQSFQAFSYVLDSLPRFGQLPMNKCLNQSELLVQMARIKRHWNDFASSIKYFESALEYCEGEISKKGIQREIEEAQSMMEEVSAQQNGQYGSTTQNVDEVAS
jgi:hypothetical protein